MQTVLYNESVCYSTAPDSDQVHAMNILRELQCLCLHAHWNPIHAGKFLYPILAAVYLCKSMPSVFSSQAFSVSAFNYKASGQSQNVFLNQKYCFKNSTVWNSYLALEYITCILKISSYVRLFCNASRLSVCLFFLQSNVSKKLQ